MWPDQDGMEPTMEVCALEQDQARDPSVLIFSSCPWRASNLPEKLELTRTKAQEGDCVYILIAYKLCVDFLTIWIEVYNNKLEQKRMINPTTVNEALYRSNAGCPSLGNRHIWKWGPRITHLRWFWSIVKLRGYRPEEGSCIPRESRTDMTQLLAVQMEKRRVCACFFIYLSTNIY